MIDDEERERVWIECFESERNNVNKIETMEEIQNNCGVERVCCDEVLFMGMDVDLENDFDVDLIVDPRLMVEE